MPTYYSTIDWSQSGMLLKEQISALIISTHDKYLPYTSNYQTDTWDALKKGDTNPEDTTLVLLIYGDNDEDSLTNNDRTRSVYASCHSSSCTGLWVREHVFAKSLAEPRFGTTEAGADIHNLRPVDAQRNISKNNRKFAAGQGGAHITSQGYWYPGDEWKGDVARIIMYMYLRYPFQCNAAFSGISERTFSLYDDMLDIFLEWNAEDPVSEQELYRNDISEKLQGNRNPFIDNPFLATLIWNGPEAVKQWEMIPTATIEHHLPAVSILSNITDGIVRFSGLRDAAIDYYVYHIDGRTVLNGRLINNEIDMTSLQSGMYVLLIQTPENRTKAFQILRK